jgi:hypothetical protein
MRPEKANDAPQADTRAEPLRGALQPLRPGVERLQAVIGYTSPFVYAPPEITAVPAA